MAEKLEIAFSFSEATGMMLLGTLDAEMAGGNFNVSERNVGAFLDTSADFLKEEAEEAKELGIVKSWLGFLVALSPDEARALRGGYSNLTFSEMGISAMLDEEWQLIFRYAYKRIFNEEPPTTPEEKAKVKAKVTITDTEKVDQFRARMKAEGRLDE